MTETNTPQNRPFPDDPELHKIWDLSRKSDPLIINSPGNAETEEALQAVHQRIGLRIPDEAPGESATRHAESFWLWSRYLAAAVALIIAGAYYLFVPVTVTAPYGERVTLNLPDGSVTELNSGSALTYNRFFFDKTGRNLSLNGEAWFDVEPGDIPFEVEANGTLTRVLGTTFNIRSWSTDPGSETEITVTSGRVEFLPVGDASKKVTLQPGEYSRWNSRALLPSQPETVSVDDITGWRENRLIFREQTLTVIIDELERRFNTQIDLEVPEASSETITAYYNRPQQLRAVLDDISMVKGLRYAETANGYRIFK